MLNKIYTRGLAIAKRSRVSICVSTCISICVTKFFGQAQARGRGRPCKFFRSSIVRSPSEIGCCVIPCGRACGRLLKIVGSCGAATRERNLKWPSRNTPVALPLGKGIVHDPLVALPSPHLWLCWIWLLSVKPCGRTYGEPLEKLQPLCPAFQGHSRSTEPTLIDCLPVTSY